MVSDDDERGIDWLASQLDPETAGAGTDSPDDSAAEATDDAKTDVAKTDAAAPDVAAPTSRFGRRARRAKAAVAEPEVVEPVVPAVPAVPAGPAPWWTTPLPQPVEAEVDAADAADAAEDAAPATPAGHEVVPPPHSEPVLDPRPAAGSEPVTPAAVVAATVPAAVVPAAVVPAASEVAAVESAAAEPDTGGPVTVAPATAELGAAEPVASEPVTAEAPAAEQLAPPAVIAGELLEQQATAATELLPVSATDTRVPHVGASIRLADADADADAEASTDRPRNTEAPNRHRSRRVLAEGTQAALVWTAVGLLALIVLVGLFYLGQRLVASPVAAPAPTQSATPTPTPSPTPTPIPEVTAVQAAGAHEWNTLFGGECLEPYVSPWEEEFTVVDCAVAHTAQLVYRGSFGGDATTVFPGEAALAAQINLLCTAPGILDLNAAGTYPNLQIQGSYPITDEQWATGPRNYYCFVSRASAEPLAATIMGAGPAA
ncbi:hypothetical protein [Cryobacterium sp. PH31-L1]|uniref:hypothetical protein n=1 Tax=Cryobacterium sp. PH31-L1 TaxID=3046199 RepID=UPI0024BA39E4|nr:hypothetical protein [Cryobacterium sp. PH31-L1]MDJ0377272.1 hypothetical protein [Cryobacterium sp. PH31-L1]